MLPALFFPSHFLLMAREVLGKLKEGHYHLHFGLGGGSRAESLQKGVG